MKYEEALVIDNARGMDVIAALAGVQLVNVNRVLRGMRLYYRSVGLDTEQIDKLLEQASDDNSMLITPDEADQDVCSEALQIIANESFDDSAKNIRSNPWESP